METKASIAYAKKNLSTLFRKPENEKQMFMYVTIARERVPTECQ